MLFQTCGGTTFNRALRISGPSKSLPVEGSTGKNTKACSSASSITLQKLSVSARACRERGSNPAIAKFKRKNQYHLCVFHQAEQVGQENRQKIEILYIIITAKRTQIFNEIHPKSFEYIYIFNFLSSVFLIELCKMQLFPTSKFM